MSEYEYHRWSDGYMMFLQEHRDYLSCRGFTLQEAFDAGELFDRYLMEVA